jgi:hypothetical protein
MVSAFAKAELVFAKASFDCLVRFLAKKYLNREFSFDPQAMLAMQSATVSHIVSVVTLAYDLAKSYTGNPKITLSARHIQKIYECDSLHSHKLHSAREKVDASKLFGKGRNVLGESGSHTKSCRAILKAAHVSGAVKEDVHRELMFSIHAFLITLLEKVDNNSRGRKLVKVSDVGFSLKSGMDIEFYGLSNYKKRERLPKLKEPLGLNLLKDPLADLSYDMSESTSPSDFS